ncbi:sialidase family protein [Actinomadura hibisca]|uniref:sialidase family protein n=1 Tax=Actinomadura hibisca TaxID=68565 RepID=UPI000831FDC2|nr:sialidase family protein [Actinomadura hibisca]
MTDPRTPDGHDERERSEERPGDPGVAPPPPPPQWGQAPAPGPQPLPEFGVPLPEHEESASERTVTDLDISGAMRTRDFPNGEQRPAAQRPDAQRQGTQQFGDPGQGSYNPDATIADMSAFMPAAGEQPDQGNKHTREETRPAAPASGTGEAPATEQVPQADQTVRYQPPPPFAQQPQQPPAPPAPEPFPYAQEIPDNKPAAPQPFPYAQEVPGQQQAPEPFPYAQEIPSNKPQAPEPFPYAQEVPGQQQAPEPFPYAQEIPGQQQAQHQAGPAPFPYAQEVPGQPQAPADSPRPFAPPPQIDEPWLLGVGGGGDQPGPAKKSRKGGGGPKRSRKPLIIAVAGVAVVAVVAGGVVALTGGGEDEQSGGAKLAGAAFPPASALRSDGRDQAVTSVAGAGSTLVAVGGETDADGGRGVFLCSSDGGRTFVTAAMRDGQAAAPGEIPQVVGGSAGGWVAIGARPGSGVVWTSADGATWSREPDAVGDVFNAHTRVRRIVGGGSGFLALGEVTSKGDFSDAQPAVWVSGDGRRWEARVGGQIGLQVDRGKLELTEAAVSGQTMLIEGIHTPGKGQAAYRRVWSSTDGGRSWSGSAVPVPKGSRGLLIGGGPTGFVAIRELPGRRSYGQAFVSKDGQSWSAAGRVLAAGYRRVQRIVADQNGFAAVVVRGRDLLVSRSANGRSWKDAGSLPLRQGVEPLDAAVAGGQTVMVGRQAGGGDTNALVNVWDSAGRALPVDLAKVPGALRSDHRVAAVGAASGRAVAVGSAGGDASVWTSQDGNAWQAAQGLGAAFTRPGEQRLTGVAGGGNGWLAVGYDQTAPRRPLVVTSADGATWQAVDGLPAFRGNSRTVPATAATAAGPNGYVIVGTNGTAAAAWHSADLKNWQRAASADRQALEARPGVARWLLGVAATSAGYVAVGGARQARDGGAAGNRPGTWTSADGKSWTFRELPLPSGGVTEGHLTHVAAKGGTVVALGVGATPQGLVRIGYQSGDGGANWRPITSLGDDPKAAVTALTATPQGFAAAGTTGRPGSTDVVSWTSADGASWETATPGGEGLGGPGDQQVTGLAVLGTSLLGVGHASGPKDEQPVLWTRPVP